MKKEKDSLTQVERMKKENDSLTMTNDDATKVKEEAEDKHS